MNLKGELGVPLARLVQAVTSVVLVNNTALTIDTTVPVGKRWLLLNIRATNPDNVDRVIDIWKYLEAAKTNAIKRYGRFTAVGTAEYVNIPNSDVDNLTDNRFLTTPEVLDVGNTIYVNWGAGGASAGATDVNGLVIEYLEIDYP